MRKRRRPPGSLQGMRAPDPLGASPTERASKIAESSIITIQQA